MDVETVFTSIKRTFGDESAVQVTEADIIRWINEAQREAVMHNESLLQASVKEDIVSGTREYAFPTDLLVLRSLRIKMRDMSDYYVLQHLNLQEFDRRVDNRISSHTGVPFMYTTYDRKIFLYPTPDANETDGLEILYSQRPTDITSSSDPIDLPEEYHNALLRYCMSQATVQDENYEGSAYHKDAFHSSIRTLGIREQYGNYETYPTISVMPEDW